MRSDQQQYQSATLYADTHRAARFIAAITRESVAKLMARLVNEELQRVRGREREITEAGETGEARSAAAEL